MSHEKSGEGLRWIMPAVCVVNTDNTSIKTGLAVFLCTPLTTARASFHRDLMACDTKATPQRLAGPSSELCTLAPTLSPLIAQWHSFIPVDLIQSKQHYPTHYD